MQELASLADSDRKIALDRLEQQRTRMKTRKIIRAAIPLAIAVAGSLLFAAETPEDEARKSAQEWLSLVDAEKFAESWEDAAQYFNAAISQEQWGRSLEALRKPLGSLVSRKLLSAKYTRSLPGAPDGEYVVLQYQTSFANKKDAVETVTPMRDKDGQWRVSGYYIK